MSIFSRYIVAELLKVFSVSLTAMTLVMILIGIVQEAVRESLTPLTIVRLLPYVLPNALCFAIPGTILFSVCIVYGRMAAHNEILAIKSAGIPPTRAVWPALVLAFLMSVTTVILNDVAVSWGRQGIYRVILHSVESTIYAVLNAERAYQRGRLSIVVQDVTDHDLIGPIVQYYHDDDSQARFSAERARLAVDPQRDMLVFTVHNAHLSITGRDVSASLPDGTIEIPLRDATRARQDHENPSVMPLRAMHDEYQRQQRILTDQQQERALSAAFQLAGGDLVALTHPRWIADLAEVDEAKHRLHRLRTEPWRRWANGFSCLCFVLVGIPLAIYLRKADFWTSFAVVFLPILLMYYPLLMWGLSRAKSGDIPPPSVWLGNLVLAAIGVWLIQRVLKH